MSYSFGWANLPSELNVTSYKVARYPEGQEPESLDDLVALTVATIVPGEDLLEFTDLEELTNNTAYHYVLLGLSGDEVVYQSAKRRRWYRTEWYYGPSEIVSGDEDQGFIGFLSANDVPLSEWYSAANSSYVGVVKLIYKKKIHFAPLMVDGFTASSARNITTVRSWATTMRARTDVGRGLPSFFGEGLVNNPDIDSVLFNMIFGTIGTDGFNAYLPYTAGQRMVNLSKVCFFNYGSTGTVDACFYHDTTGTYAARIYNHIGVESVYSRFQQAYAVINGYTLNTNTTTTGDLLTWVCVGTFVEP